MSDVPQSGAAPAHLGEKRLSTIHAIGQYAYLKVRHPDRIRNAASHAIEHHGVPPLDETLEFEPTPSDTLLRPKEV